MDTIVWILILLTAFNFLLKQTFWRPVAVCVMAAVAGGFVLLVWPLAIEQSKTQIADWLADQGLMLDTAVILTVEVALQIAFCLLSVHLVNFRPVRKKTRIAWKILYWFPGILFFPVLFFGLTQLIFALPGISFVQVAAGFALFVTPGILLGRWILKQFLPEEELRLELLFLINALVAVLGVVATVNGRTAVEGTAAVNWQALAGCIALLCFGGGIGWLIRIIRTL